MQGKTHLAVGSALALALLPPAGMHTLIIGTGAAALGSVVSDIDSGHSGAGQDAADRSHGRDRLYRLRPHAGSAGGLSERLDSGSGAGLQQSERDRLVSVQRNLGCKREKAGR